VISKAVFVDMKIKKKTLKHAMKCLTVYNKLRTFNKNLIKEFIFYFIY
jgi:hypothetical protein